MIKPSIYSGNRMVACVIDKIQPKYGVLVNRRMWLTHDK